MKITTYLRLMGLFFVLSFALWTQALARATFPVEKSLTYGTVVRDPLLKRVESKFSKSSAVEIDLEKTMTLSITNSVNKSSGKLFLKGKDKSCLEFTKPQKVSYIIKGSDLWVVEENDLDDQPQIFHRSFSDKAEGQLLIGSFLGAGNILLNFKLENKNETKKDEVVFDLLPIKPFEGIKKLQIIVNKSEEKLRLLSYWDDLGNKVEFSFNKIIFNAQIPEEKFKPPVNGNISYF